MVVVATPESPATHRRRHSSCQCRGHTGRGRVAAVGKLDLGQGFPARDFPVRLPGDMSASRWKAPRHRPAAARASPMAKRRSHAQPRVLPPPPASRMMPITARNALDCCMLRTPPLSEHRDLYAWRSAPFQVRVVDVCIPRPLQGRASKAEWDWVCQRRAPLAESFAMI